MSSTPFDHIRQVSEARRRVVADFMTRRNVVACGVGYKIKSDQPTNVPSIVVSVTQKQPPEMLSAADLIPQAVDGVLTDVVATGEIVAYAVDRRSRMRPVRPGVSIGHVRGSTGTVGCFVRRNGELFILSNNHVLALLNDASKGDAILQPGPGDGGTPADQIGVLADFVPLSFLPEVAEEPEGQAQAAQPQGCAALIAQLMGTLGSLGQAQTSIVPPLGAQDNYVDAALAGPLPPDLVNTRIVDVGGPPLGITEPQLGMRVIKSGRTTGLTQATVTQIDVTVAVKYGGRMARFVDQIMTAPLSQPGDSGSLVLDYERNAVGLLFSGSEVVTVVSPIQPVLTALSAELVTEGGT